MKKLVVTAMAIAFGAVVVLPAAAIVVSPGAYGAQTTSATTAKKNPTKKKYKKKRYKSKKAPSQM